jgi:Urease accessory protein UreF
MVTAALLCLVRSSAWPQNHSMKNRHLGTLLHLCDPTLPIGSFAHSNGLETYVQSGRVCDATSVCDFVRNMLSNNIKYNDAAFVRLSFEAASSFDLATVILLDQECTALKCPKEIRQASIKLGLRILKIFSKQTKHCLARDYQQAIWKNAAEGHYSIAFGLFASLFNIPVNEALLAFYYNAAVGMITNSVKLVPLGQLDGQQILFQLHPLFRQLAKETLMLERELVGLCNIGFDIHCMQHEILYSRLYMS